MPIRLSRLLLVGLFACGCKTADEKRTDPAPRPAGRSWLDGPGPRLTDVGVPKANTWADAREPGYDLAKDTVGMLAGFVEDPDGRKVREAFIEIEAADDPGEGAPVGTKTDRDGYFLIKGLRPDQAYQLTVRGQFDGTASAGRVYVRTGSPAARNVRLPLIAGLNLPDRVAPPADDRPPREPRPVADPRPEPKPQAPTSAGEPPNRPELSTHGPPGLDRPPVTNIPAPGTARPPERAVRSTPPAGGLTLLTPAGVERQFPGTGLVLLAFQTTQSERSRQALPGLKELASRYAARGLEVAGVVCDAADQGTRQTLADRHRRDMGLNFLLYVEPGDRPGAVASKLKVTAYPTLVLVDAGGVVWQGGPGDPELEATIRDRLR